jgi:thioredoxin reductase (NADPH)
MKRSDRIGDAANGAGAPARLAPRYKPILMAVDDDQPVLSAIVRDLRAEFGDRYDVQGARSGAEALEMLRELRARARQVALILTDQRMPGITGIDLLRDAAELAPGARRVLLTAYADNEVAIRAINEIGLDHYLMKPWHPPEEALFPVLRDLLEEWSAERDPLEPEIRIVDFTWSADAHRIRDFLTRNLVPFRWVELEEGAETARLLELCGTSDPRLPLVVMPDGTVIERPDRDELAQRIGLKTRPNTRAYDLVIVGAGPAGLAAGVAAATEGMKTLIVERDAPGGQAGRSKRIENYLGFPVGLSGGDLARRAVAQARRFGVEILTPVEVTELTATGGYHALRLTDGSEVSARAVLIAAGVSYRVLDLPGAERLTGSGIYYGAASSEALSVRGRDVYVLGGGNSAGQAAMHLSRFARSVTLIVRGRSLAVSMSRYLVEQVEGAKTIGVVTSTELVGVSGEDHLESLMLLDTRAGLERTVPASALFVFIGARPRTEWLPERIRRDDRGHVLTGHHLLDDGAPPAGWTPRRSPLPLETSVPGVFVAGDVRHRSAKGVAAAVGEGAMVLQQIRQYLGGGGLLAPPSAVAQSIRVGAIAREPGTAVLAP